jgi:hypothetical protein
MSIPFQTQTGKGGGAPTSPLNPVCFGERVGSEVYVQTDLSQLLDSPRRRFYNPVNVDCRQSTDDCNYKPA